MDPATYFAAVIWPHVQSVLRFSERWYADAGLWAGSNERGRISIDWKSGKSYFAIMVQETGKPMRSIWVTKGSGEHKMLSYALPPFGTSDPLIERLDALQAAFSSIGWQERTFPPSPLMAPQQIWPGFAFNTSGGHWTQ